MKVLHVSTAMTWRGGEQQITYLYEILREQGVDQFLVCVSESLISQYPTFWAGEYETLGKQSSLSLTYTRGLARIVKREKPDLVHVHDSHGHTFCVLATLLFGMRVPIILHRRVDYPVSSTWFSRYKYNFPAIVKIICVSHAVKRVLDQSLKDTSKSVVVHSGVDLAKFHYTDSRLLKNDLALPKSTQLVGNVAAITQQKDYFTFVAVAERVLKEKPETHFVCIGDGDQRDEIEELVEAKGLTKNFSFLGFVRKVEVIMRGIDIFLFTSEKEGLGTTLIDAQLAVLPIVSTNAGGITEILTHERNALIADVKDVETLAHHVLKMLNDPKLAQRLAEQGEIDVERFSKENMAQEVRKIYEQTLSES